MLYCRKPHYWAIWRRRLLIIHHTTKNFDRLPNYGPKSKLKIEAVSHVDIRKPNFWPMGLTRQLLFHLRTKFDAKMLIDAHANYGQKSKFKMVAVRHLGILILPYRTTHEVFSLGYISLTNFVLFGYIMLKIWGFEFFAEMAWNAYLRPKISVFGGLDP